MSNYELLNNIKHRDLRVIIEYGAHLGDNVVSAPTYVTEFRDVISEYPIMIQKDSETGEFNTIALFGFETGENLFLDEKGGWDAGFVPAYVKRGPFLIGLQKGNGEEKSANKPPMIHVDMDSPRISKHGDEGIPVFLEQGGNSDYLEHINSALSAIYAGLEVNRRMLAAYDKLGLIEEFRVEVKLNDGSVNQLSGFYTIHEEKLAALSEEDALQLYKSGFLEPAYLIMASLVNVKKLLLRKNKRLGLL